MESPLSKHYEDLSLQYVEQDRAFEMQLVEGTHRRESIQKQALESAAKAHKAIRDNAMLDLEMIAIEAERKRLRLEAEQNRLAEEAKRKLDEERAAELHRLQAEREKDEARQREAERIERERKEAEQRAAAQQQQREEQARKAREQKDKEAAEARAAQLEEQKLQEEQKRQQTIQQEKSQPPRASHPPAAAAPTAVTSIASSSRDEIEKEHATFLAMKQALKQTKDRLDQAKNQDAWLKENLGEKCRRRIKMLVNQVNKHNRDENRRKVISGCNYGHEMDVLTNCSRLQKSKRSWTMLKDVIPPRQWTYQHFSTVETRSRTSRLNSRYFSLTFSTTLPRQ